MKQLALTQENTLDIIQRSYTYLSGKYDFSNRSIVDYTYSFLYKSFCHFDRKSESMIRHIKKDKRSSYKSMLRGFLFVDVTPNQHYFFLPEECLIIECNNGKFSVLDFLGQGDDKTQYPKIINLMLSSLDANVFLKFKNFNKFYTQDFPINDFCNKLKVKDRVAVKELIGATTGYRNLHTDSLYSSIFQSWLKYFLNIDLFCKKEYCTEISKEIDIDLSIKKDFYVLQLGYYPTFSAIKKREDIYSQYSELELKLYSAFKDTFSKFINFNLTNPLNFYYHNLTYLRDIGKKSFFIPAKGSEFNWDTVSYFVFSSIGECFTIRYIGEFLKTIEADTTISNPNKRNLYNDIFTKANIQKDDFLYKLQDYFFAISFGYDETRQLIHKYALHNYNKTKELIENFEYQDIFKISEDEFLLRMKRIYKLLQDTKQLQVLDCCRQMQELNDYILVSELDNDDTVI